MKTTMTEKDKRLLVGMFMFVIIVAIGYWGIIPQIKAYSELEAKIEKEESVQKINKMKIANASLIEMQVEDYGEKLNAVKDDFYPILSSADVDRMFTQMALNRKLNIYELKFNMPQAPTDRLAYVYSPLNQLQLEQQGAYEEIESVAETTGTKTTEDKGKSKDSTETSSESGSTDSKSMEEMTSSMMGVAEGSYAPNTRVYAVPVSITVGGEVKDLEAFLEEMNSLEKCSLVTGFSWGEYQNYKKWTTNGTSVSAGTDDSTEAVEGVTAEELVTDTTVKKSLTVRLEIYMLDTASLDKSPAEEEPAESEE